MSSADRPGLKIMMAAAFFQYVFRASRLEGIASGGEVDMREIAGHTDMMLRVCSPARYGW